MPSRVGDEPSLVLPHQEVRDCGKEGARREKRAEEEAKRRRRGATPATCSTVCAQYWCQVWPHCAGFAALKAARPMTPAWRLRPGRQTACSTARSGGVLDN